MEKSTKNKLLLDDKYILGDIIGQGTYAKVRIAINKFTKKKFAIKIYDVIHFFMISQSFVFRCP